MRIRDSRLTFSDLEQLGYTRVAALPVSGEDGIALVATAATAARSADATLVVGHSGATELLVSHADGRTASFAAGSLFFSALRISFSSFRDIVRLVLPLQLGVTDHTWTRQRMCPLLPGNVQLPRLQSLVIYGAPRSPAGCGLLDPGIARGVIVAPLLVRLELTAPDGLLFGVRAGDLAAFIEGHLRLAKGARLEVVIDTTNGVRLESAHGSNDLSRLQRCIGTLIL